MRSLFLENNLTNLNNKTFDYLETNDTIQFILGNSTHTLLVENITNSSVTLEINSTPITTTLTVNETKALDLNGDGKNDFSVKLVTISQGTVTLLLKAINEPVGVLGILEGKTKTTVNFDLKVFEKTLSKLNTKLGKWKWYILIGFAVVVIALIVIISVMKKKHGGKYTYVKIDNKSIRVKKREGGGIRVEKD